MVLPLQQQWNRRWLLCVRFWGLDAWANQPAGALTQNWSLARAVCRVDHLEAHTHLSSTSAWGMAPMTTAIQTYHIADKCAVPVIACRHADRIGSDFPRVAPDMLADQGKR
jgi:hypothetical protein